jgi:hypothetical protein
MRSWKCVVAFLPVLMVTGCGGSSVSGIASGYNEAADIMATVKDEASLNEAKPKLMKAAERIRTAMLSAAKDNPSGSWTPEQQKTIQQAKDKFDAQAKRIAAIPGGTQVVMDVGMAMLPLEKK